MSATPGAGGPDMTPLGAADITGLVLAGGRGSRMDGADKGLQRFRGVPLALHAARRLAPQVGRLMINANRNLPAYEAFGFPVRPDGLAGHAGPLAGFLAGLEHCRTPYLLTVPCDTPLFPCDLGSRLAEALGAQEAEIAMVGAPGSAERAGAGPGPFAQPVFCLLRATLLDSLAGFLRQGGRKVDSWTASHRTVLVPFDRPGDAPDAFFNANTLAELQALEAGSG